MLYQYILYYTILYFARDKKETDVPGTRREVGGVLVIVIVIVIGIVIVIVIVIVILIVIVIVIVIAVEIVLFEILMKP